MAWHVARLNRKVEYWIFYGADFLLLPALVARLLGARMVLALAGNLENETRLKKNVLNGVQMAMRKAVFALSERIVLYSSTLMTEWHLERYRKKILVADSHFLNLDVYRVERSVESRGRVVDMWVA